jgi:hypothetical protein
VVVPETLTEVAREGWQRRAGSFWYKIVNTVAKLINVGDKFVYI